MEEELESDRRERVALASDLALLAIGMRSPDAREKISSVQIWVCDTCDEMHAQANLIDDTALTVSAPDVDEAIEKLIDGVKRHSMAGVVIARGDEKAVPAGVMVAKMAVELLRAADPNAAENIDSIKISGGGGTDLTITLFMKDGRSIVGAGSGTEAALADLTTTIGKRVLQ